MSKPSEIDRRVTAATKSCKVILTPGGHHKFVSLLAANQDTAQAVLAQAITDYLALADDPPGQPVLIEAANPGALITEKEEP